MVRRATESMEDENQNPRDFLTLRTKCGDREDARSTISFEYAPARLYHFSNQFQTDLNFNNFHKGVKWSPDGSCFLTSSEDNNLRIFPLPDSSSSNDVGAWFQAGDCDSYPASLVIYGGESVYDFCWYPYMTTSDIVTCVFATTARDHPVHLWDATSGKLRCTYRAYDAMDEIIAAISIAFNPAGTRIFAGYNKHIHVFDLHRPGRDFEQYSTVNENKEGQTGIISSIAFCPTHSGMLAMGSYDHSAAIYREDKMELLYVLHGQEGGVTHVQFSKDGNYLFSGARKFSFCCRTHIYCVGIYGKRWKWCTNFTDPRRRPISV